MLGDERDLEIHEPSQETDAGGFALTAPAQTGRQGDSSGVGTPAQLSSKCVVRVFHLRREKRGVTEIWHRRRADGVPRGGSKQLVVVDATRARALNNFTPRGNLSRRVAAAAGAEVL